MTRTILLADDSVTIQKVVELTFMDQDYEIVAVSDGSAAVAKLPDLKPDLLIADVHMPGADGYEVCRRSKATHPDVPVLLLVGTFEHFDEAAAAAAGADSHLKKPFDSQDLLHQVEALISGAARPGEGEAAAPADDLELAEDEAAFELEEALEDEEPLAEEEDATEPSLGTPFPLSAAAEAAPAEAAPAEPSFEDAWGTADSGTPMVASPLLGGSPATDEAPPAAPEFEDPWGVEAPATEPPAAPATEPAMEPLTVEAPAFEEPPAAEAPFEPPPAAEAPFEPPSFEAPPVEPPSPAAPPEEPSAEEAAPPAAEPVAEAPTAGADGLSDEDVDRIARRVMKLAGDKALREVAWEVVPDLAEVIIKERIRELESQVE